MSGQDQDDNIILPYTTAQKKMKGNAWLDDILVLRGFSGSVKIAGPGSRRDPARSPSSAP